MTLHPERLLLDAVVFEQWLRFAWMDDGCRIVVPDGVRDRLRSGWPELTPILDALDAVVIDDGEASMSAITATVRPLIGDDALSSACDDPGFQRTVQAFHRWVQDEAENPTVDERDFTAWLTAFLSTVEKDAG